MVRNFLPYLIAFVAVLLFAFGVIRGMEWIGSNPQHNPAARFELAHLQGWATQRKLRELVSDDDACFAAFDRAGAGYERRAPIGEGACRASQRMILTSIAKVPSLAPAAVAPGCAVTAAMALWNRDVVQPLAQRHFGQKVVRLATMGSYNCRKIAGRDAQSEHSTANAIDISAFVLADGTRVSVLDDWDKGDAKGAFLHAVRDGACDLFSTTLSPDYNRAHADHFHLDMAVRTAGWSACR
ncbi:MAG: extensin family protein [Sphingopyxis sp.]|uniref:extensin-like domain-containing protein n=1 Tax=Sphingopyxis sp. TaxID=1908224 RepID=UPI002ABB64E7|nr:extensin family protein [Sphingopyxis sp.]MDZ3833478.1 extensin family protein [Sphingopyxis sp.]